MAQSKISAAELREKTGLTDRRHRQLADQGYFPAPTRGQYDREKTIDGMFRYYRELLHKKDSKLVKEQYELTKTKRETAQEELAALRKLYIKKEEIGPALRNLSAHQRAVLQRLLENELGPNLAGHTTAEILQRMKETVDQVCRVFEEGIAEWLIKPTS